LLHALVIVIHNPHDALNAFILCPVGFLLILLDLLQHVVLVVEFLPGFAVLLSEGLVQEGCGRVLVAVSDLNIARVEEPNVSIIILEELGLHLQYLPLVYLLHVVRDLEALLLGK